MRPILLSSFSVLGLTIAQDGTCYFANGTALPNDPLYNQYKPCMSGGPLTICCGIDRDNIAGGNVTEGDTMDECLPNGLCQNRVTTDGIEEIKFFVDFCTDSDMNSGNCLNVCDQVRDSFGIARMTPCSRGQGDSDRWCCGDSIACCSSNVGVVTLAQVMGGTVSSSVPSDRDSASETASSALASSTLTSASETAVSISPTGTEALATASAAPKEIDESSGLPGGAIAGIVVSAVVGLALLAAAIFFARRASKYKRQAATSKYTEPLSAYPSHHPDQGYVSSGSDKYAQQMQHTQGFTDQAAPSELGPAQPSELPTGEGASPTRTIRNK